MSEVLRKEFEKDTGVYSNTIEAEDITFFHETYVHWLEQKLSQPSTPIELEWVKENAQWNCEALGNTYVIYLYAGDRFYKHTHTVRYFSFNEDSKMIGGFENFEEAAQAAQSHFNQLILSCIKR